MTVKFYCSCGLAVVARGKAPLPAQSLALVEGIQADHLAMGHEAVSGRQCAVARRRAYMAVSA